MGDGGQDHAQAILPTGKTWCQLYRMQGEQRQGRSGQVQKISTPSGFNPCTVESVASCYDYYSVWPMVSLRLVLKVIPHLPNVFINASSLC